MRIVLTGGPGAGKTAVLELLRHSLCEHVLILSEAAAAAKGAGIVLCDRGQSTARPTGRALEISGRRLEDGYGHTNPLRVESAVDARRIDNRILRTWDGHPRRYVIDAADDFMKKAERAMEILRAELPDCCRDHAARALRACLTEFPLSEDAASGSKPQNSMKLRLAGAL